ncbi:DUF1740-domain-containing protein [Jackrogersella minutella]|nr:DUF1740-domain-containing protein [Jackrogersella minutella]
MSSEQRKGSSVPIFSFKPKPYKSQSQKDNRDDESSRHDVRQVSQKKDLHRLVPDTSHQTNNTRHHKVSHRSSGLEEEKDTLFVYDKRGDSLIRKYGSVDRRDIPNYRRFGSGRILGVDGYMRINRIGSRDEFFMLGYHESRPLLSSDRKTLLAKGGHYKSRPVRVRQEKSQTVIGSEDFVSLKPPRKRKRDGSEAGDSSGEEGQSYRSIHGKSKRHEHSESDVDYASDSSADLGSRKIDDPINLRSIKLFRRTRNHPEDIDAWLELVDHQDTLLQSIGGNGHQPTAAEVKSFAYIKLTLLEQAYSHATTNAQREKLQLRIMREGSKIWDAKALSKRWDEALGKHEDSFEVWMEYINFRQGRLLTFEYEKIKGLYSDRLFRLQEEAWRLNMSESDQIKLFEQVIYIFLRLTRFISDAGYKELATAAWQSTLETALAPPGTEQTHAEIFDFREFWESEAPRMGEVSAQGWIAAVRSGATLEPPEPKGLETFAAPNIQDRYKAWANVEQHKSRAAAYPARTMDDGAEDDPFRVVMYTDILGVALDIPPKIVPHIQNQLLDAFLIFCQLPPAFYSSDIIHVMTQDGFLGHIPAKSITSNSPPDFPDPAEQHRRPPEFSQDYQRMIITPDVLFPLSQWFNGMKVIRDNIPADQYQWISTTLNQLIFTYKILKLAPYYLAFKSANEPGNEKKTAKALLKLDPANVDLYRGYSSVEWARGNTDIARNAITAPMSLETIPIHDKISLGIAAAWMEIEDGDMAKAILQLCALSINWPSAAEILESPSASIAQILRARHFLSTGRDWSMSSGDVKKTVVYAEALSLFEYLTRESNKEQYGKNQGDIWSAMDSISTCSDELVSRGLGNNPSHEQLLQSAAHLLYYHASKRPARQGFLREHLTKYIKLFPNNTIFLNLFTWRESRLSVDDKVRSILDDVVLIEPYDCVTSRMFTIRHESRTGNIYSTQAAFEHAVESEACKNNPGLWVSYIRFCHDKEEFRPKAQDVFLRAFHNCPWSKEVFMEAFVTLVDQLDSVGLRSVYRELSGRGLRVHVEMDEFLEKWRLEHNEKSAAKW